ncbi:hypothetical protein D9619_005152 [Psilocybe cf. subviscida]|uniref:Uncharacterized protein n=1 Tax=Psilocybe cf. subviscida TaxID=2480587 RepID=A0A8H5F8P1_9AGAR|nr:hypothetical protein D9619_005152 [Psilocybe cf. subviscida]
MTGPLPGERRAEYRYARAQEQDTKQLNQLVWDRTIDFSMDQEGSGRGRVLLTIEVGVDQGRVLEAYTEELSLALVLDNRILHEASEIQAEMALALFDAKPRLVMLDDPADHLGLEVAA